MLYTGLRGGVIDTMKKFIRFTALLFLFITGALAAMGLILIDQSLKIALNPVPLKQSVTLPDSFNAVPFTIHHESDESINAIYIDIPESTFVVLFCHSGKGNLYTHLEFLKHLKMLGLSVLAIDYRGFGLSDTVDITDDTLISDIKRSYDLLKEKNWPPQHILFYGLGLSAGIQGDFLNDLPIGGWIMDNPIPSLQDAQRGNIYRLLTANRLTLYNSLGRYRGAGLVLYDPGVVSDTILETLRSTNDALTFCKITGEPIQGEMRDWTSWVTCMKTFLAQLDVSETNQMYKRVSTRKRQPDNLGKGN
jgi:pimeloyl-ACP methyl ester carboxylesterase